MGSVPKSHCPQKSKMGSVPKSRTQKSYPKFAKNLEGAFVNHFQDIRTLRFKETGRPEQGRVRNVRTDKISKKESGLGAKSGAARSS